MKKSMKMYKKALKSYQDGKIDEAIDICEKSISMSMKNSSAINLKGLLYYLKGNLDAAKGTWRLNVEVNRDNVAKKYLLDCKDDDMNDVIYVAAFQAAGGLNIREAIELLLKCAESDYNCINVYNTLSSCYIKVGEYSKAIEGIEKVLVIDKNNKAALENKKILVELSVIKKQHNYNFIISSIVAAVLILISSVGIYLGVNKFKESSRVTGKQLTDKQNVKKEVKSKQPQKIETVKTPAMQQFPYDEINKNINEKNYDQLYDITAAWRNQNLSINEKELMAKTDELFKSSGVDYFYNNGMENANKKDYDASSVYFYKAAEFGKESDLYPHIIYMLAVSLEDKGDIEKAITYYEEYSSSYPKGGYEETVLYKLALIYKPLDINKSKSYGQALVNAYPKSIYNNSIIKEIIND